MKSLREHGYNAAVSTTAEERRSAVLTGAVRFFMTSSKANSFGIFLGGSRSSSWYAASKSSAADVCWAGRAIAREGASSLRLWIKHLSKADVHFHEQDPTRGYRSQGEAFSPAAVERATVPMTGAERVFQEEAMRNKQDHGDELAELRPPRIHEPRKSGGVQA